MKNLINNYLNLYKSKGFLGILFFFFENHLFDILNSTDTAFMKKFDNQIAYMPSWTSVIKTSHKFTTKYLGNKYKKFYFVDVGSGKGKVLFLWLTLNYKNNVSQNVTGIEIDEELNIICKKNLSKLPFNNNYTICNDDILNVNFKLNNYIFFLYNPFNEDLLIKFLNKLANKNTILIFKNIDNNNLLHSMGWNLIYSHSFCHKF